MVGTLVRNGALLSMVNKHGETAFDIARKNYRGGITQNIIENYLRPSSNKTVH